MEVVGIFKDGFHWVKQTTDTVSFSPEAWSVVSGESGGGGGGRCHTVSSPLVDNKHWSLGDHRYRHTMHSI